MRKWKGEESDLGYVSEMKVLGKLKSVKGETEKMKRNH